MKTTRLILALAAVLSLGLAVFANVRANNYAASTVKASYQTTNVASASSPVDHRSCIGKDS
ncbi:MAG TPA: hypothetical protein VNU49_02175 [Opitutaceae bacterium]|jgi:hypothetical protein|nr:hypothetical protein [Opitutaceae bacterium]